MPDYSSCIARVTKAVMARGDIKDVILGSPDCAATQAYVVATCASALKAVQSDPWGTSATFLGYCTMVWLLKRGTYVAADRFKAILFSAIVIKSVNMILEGKAAKQASGRKDK